MKLTIAKTSGFALAVPVSIALMLSGCGTFVPEIQENPYSPGDGQLLVQSIVQSVHCEVIDSLQWVMSEELKFAQKYHQRPVAGFLRKWGVQISLTLTIDEKSALGPNAVWMPPSPASAVFTLGGSLGGSADATRTDKLSFYYLIKDLLKHPPCTPGVSHGNDRSLLVRSDLKLKEWLEDYLTAIATQEGVAPTSKEGNLGTNVISHEVKFDVMTSGTLTPAWVLRRATINGTAPFFSTSRDRTHDVIITLGPGDKTGFTAVAPNNADLSLQIGNAVGQNLRNVPIP